MTTNIVRPVLREATDEDGAELAAFTCSTGPWYEAEVQEYIRSRALVHARRKSGYRLLVAHERTRLIAVAAHADEALILPEGDTTFVARLQVLAIAVEDQRRKLPDGARLSDVLLATLIADAMVRHRTDIVTAIVADENVRSIGLCERNGLRSQTRYARQYLRLTGRLVHRT